ncbi:MAG: 50S ribosomal protein L29 [Patescibacteria group bacterium]
MLDIKELRKLDEKKLMEEKASLKSELVRMGFKVNSKENKDTHNLKVYRKQIARIETIINEKNNEN